MGEAITTGARQGWVDRWRGATVALGQTRRVTVQAAGGKTLRQRFFGVTGTGILFALEGDPPSTAWLVTAAHVLADPSSNWRPSRLTVLVPWLDEPREELAMEFGVTLRRGRRAYWVAHPDEDTDLACLRVTIPQRGQLASRVPRLRLSGLGAVAGPTQGATVVVLGYPGAMGPTFRPRGVVRQGLVAWVSPRPRGGDAFFIDCHVFPGNSGSPVFLAPGPISRLRPPARQAGPALLGIVTQAQIQHLPLLAGGKEVELHFRGRRKSEAVLAPNFLSLGVVQPAVRLRELLTLAARVVRRRRR